jgi:hypothetical protein
MIAFREGQVTAVMNLRRSSSPSSRGTAVFLGILVSIAHCASLKATFVRYCKTTCADGDGKLSEGETRWFGGFGPS